MTRLRPIAGIATAAALTFALSACGGGSEYCDAVEAADERFSGLDLDPTDAEALAEMQEYVTDIADSAPEETKEAWQNTADAFQALVDADGDLASIDEDTMERLSTLEADMEAVETQVQEECDIDIS